MALLVRLKLKYRELEFYRIVFGWSLEDNFARHFKSFQPKLIIQFSVKVQKQKRNDYVWANLGHFGSEKTDETTLELWDYFYRVIWTFQDYVPPPPRGTGVLLPGKQKGEKWFLFIFVTTYTDTYSLPRFMLFTQSTRLSHCFAWFCCTKLWQSLGSKCQLKSCRLSKIGEPALYLMFFSLNALEKINHGN